VNVPMPELDGYQVLEHIRSDPSRSSTRRRSWSRRSSTSETLNAGSLVDKLTARAGPSHHAAFMSIPEVRDPPSIS
jgi:CheY-like chemotaxis protein